MVFHRIKKRGDKIYNYLVEGFKLNGDAHQVQRYLGSETMEQPKIDAAIEEHAEWFQIEVIKKKALISSQQYSSTILSEERFGR